MLIYLDSCCLNRPFDDLSQERVARESEAVLSILERISEQRHALCISAAVISEADATPDVDRREKLEIIIRSAYMRVQHGETLVARTDQLVKLGFRTADAYHLAAAEEGACDRFLTCDDRLLAVAGRHPDKNKGDSNRPGQLHKRGKRLMPTHAKPKRRTPAELSAAGFEALVEKLGIADAIRYIQLYYPGRGDYTRDRHKWLDKLTHEEIIDMMRETQAKLDRRKTKRRKR